MIVPPAIQLRFNESRPHLESLQGIVDRVLLSWARENKYEYHSRPKAVEALAEKIETGRFASWSDLDDLVACAIVVPTHSHEDCVISFLDTAFNRVALKARGSANKPPETFRFDSTRWIGRIGKDPSGSRAPAVEQTLFEVQVRSAFEHAWSVTTHDLVYKGDKIDWRRARLVAQVKATVEQIDMLIDGFEEGTDLISPSPWPEIEKKARLRVCFATKVSSEQIPSELRPKDWARFADNVFGLIRASAPDRRRLDHHFDRCYRAFEQYSGDPPRSCSLFQTAMGVLSEAGLLASVEERYVPLVTAEAETFYPSLKAMTRRFAM